MISTLLIWFNIIEVASFHAKELFLTQENLSDYAENRLSASKRRILITKWVGEAWEELATSLKPTIIRGFRTCGITLAHDGSEDNEINIKQLPNYTVGQME